MANTNFKVDNGLLVAGDSTFTSNVEVTQHMVVRQTLSVNGDFTVAGNLLFSNTSINGELIPTANSIPLGNTTRRFTISADNLNISNSIIVANGTNINFRAGDGVILNTVGISVNASAISNGILNIAQGGTGANNKTLALDNLLPTQNVAVADYYLKTNGTAVSWVPGSGFTGSVGFTGSQGSQGTIGFTGSQGVIGFTGSKGDSGSLGFTGSQGNQGSIGFTGSAGTNGSTGFTGSAGTNGFTGSQGTQGNIGFTGSRGFTGSAGTNGTNGSQGFTGSQGSQGVIGFTGSAGFTGSQGVIGFTGSSGSTGFTGSRGFTGSAGVNTIPSAGAAKTSTYTLATSDVGEFVEVGTGGSITIPDATFAVGDTISLYNNTTGNITITCTITTAYIAGTNTDRATMTLATRGLATLLFANSTTAVVIGNVT